MNEEQTAFLMSALPLGRGFSNGLAGPPLDSSQS